MLILRPSLVTLLLYCTVTIGEVTSTDRDLTTSSVTDAFTDYGPDDPLPSSSSLPVSIKSSPSSTSLPPSSSSVSPTESVVADYDENQDEDETVTEATKQLSPSSQPRPPYETSPVTTPPKPTVTTSRTTTSNGDESDYDDESGPESDYESDTDGEKVDPRTRTTSRPYELEGESLSKLQKFLLSSVESLLKEALPVVLRSGQETNVTGACASSFLTLLSGLRDNKIWAYRSK